MKTFTLICYALLILLVTGFCFRAAASVTNWPDAQYLMVDQHGSIRPEGYAAGLTEIAQAEAAAAAAAAAAQAVDDALRGASNVVDDVVAALTGAIGFGYVTGYTVSFSGAAEVSTNASAQFVHVQFGALGSSNILGTAHTGHYVWHAYSESMNSTPAIKYRLNLNATSTWEFVEYQSTAEYTDTTVNGVFYDTVYRSTIWMPSACDSAFFLAFCEIIGGGGEGGLFDVYEGFSINGSEGFTGQATRDGLVWTYKCGALMSVTNEVPQ